MFKKEHFEVYKICSRDLSRYILCGIGIKKNGIMATDGKKAILVESKEENNIEGILSWQSAKRIHDLLSSGYSIKETKINDLDIGKTLVFVMESEDKKEQITIESKLINGNFPNVDKVIPTKEYKAKIHFSPKLMGGIMSYFEGNMDSSSGVDLYLYENELDAIKLEGKSKEGNKITVVLMPIKKP